MLSKYLTNRRVIIHIGICLMLVGLLIRGLETTIEQLAVGKNKVCINIDNTLNSFKAQYDYFYLKNLISTDNMVKSVSISIKYNEVSIQNDVRTENAIIQGVDDAYKDDKSINIIKGRFISHEDIVTENNSIVIDNVIATKLFCSINCIGKKVNILNKEYTVIGIYERKEDFLSSISRTSTSTVLMPYSLSMDRYNVNSLIYITVTDKCSNLIKRRIQDKMMSLESINNLELYNADESYRVALTKRNICYILLYLLLAIILLKLLCLKVKAYVKDMRSLSEDYYFKELIKRNWITCFIILLLLIAYVTIFYWGYKYIDVDLYINPDIIPRRLIDVKEFYNKVLAYSIMQNNKQHIIDEIYYTLTKGNTIINILVSMLLILFIRVKGLITLYRYKNNDGIGCNMHG